MRARRTRVRRAQKAAAAEEAYRETVQTVKEELKLACDKANRLLRLLGSFAVWIRDATDFSSLLVNFQDVLSPESCDLARRRLSEINEVLHNCRQLQDTCARQMRTCTALGKGGRADSIRAQLQSAKLNLNLIVRFIDDFN